ncbi:LysM peptidoglycan-binding domain-containing protein [Filibacter tadaridae]|uniref:Elastin-binding protein EbpS n=1 Tax=Filibacter tadaridae TaxID=2483811 RepID=A0A3P5XEL2_9BACL|nr:LysM peptidoglycan-binding domain-containing protein [Filibacter tadaridae]VDC29296.1 Elastin-binding protein EbpS [Filibacter tadaridae]
MEKDDYKTEFEEHRKEISFDDELGEENLPSRAELHRKNHRTKKKSGHMMINIVLGLFTLVPVVILVYVISDFYNPGDATSAKVEDQAFLYETSNKNTDGKNDTEKDISVDDAEKEKNKETKPVTKTNPVDKVDSKPVIVEQPKKEVEPEEKGTPKTHKVASNENLYRISLKYYGSGNGVDKIKKANGLSSNEIVVGQTLVIP